MLELHLGVVVILRCLYIGAHAKVGCWPTSFELTCECFSSKFHSPDYLKSPSSRVWSIGDRLYIVASIDFREDWPGL